MYFYLFSNINVGSIIFTYNKRTGGILIDSMDNSWPDYTINS